MMDKPSEDRPCECGMPAKWIVDPNFPIEFDEQMNEYHLVHNGAWARMRYCFWCGGCLLDSKRRMFFTTPDPAEKDEIQSLMADAKSLEDVYRILGPPDETLERNGSLSGPGIAIYWKKIHRYSTRWKSLVLDVPDLPDGHRHYGFSGRYLGKPENGDSD